MSNTGDRCLIFSSPIQKKLKSCACTSVVTQYWASFSPWPLGNIFSIAAGSWKGTEKSL